MRGLFLLAAASLVLSATTVAALGLEDLRIVVFAALFAALAAGALALCPRVDGSAAVAPSVALWLLMLLAAIDQLSAQATTASLVDYKIALPITALLLAPNLRVALGGPDLPRLVVGLGVVYITVTTLAALAIPSTTVLRGVTAHVRVDVTGSVVLHASLATIIALVTGAALARPGPVIVRALLLLVLAAAAWIVMLTATRSAVLTLVVFGGLWLAAGRLPELARARTLGLALAALALFLLLSLVVSDSLWSRLVELGGAGYSSGRWHAIQHWLALAAGKPFGLGLGAVRQLLAGGRPEIAGGHLLEWPHNELVRFYVEGGILGVVLVLTLIIEVIRRARRRAMATTDPVERVVVLAIAADMLVQCLLQNYFNSVYHATVLLMILGMLAAADERPVEGRPASSGTGRQGAIRAPAP
jgi:O-antigen ligase